MLTQNERVTLLKIVGARHTGHHFMAIYGEHGTVYREAKVGGRVLKPLANGLTLMASQVTPLIDAEFVCLTTVQGQVCLKQTDKRE